MPLGPDDAYNPADRVFLVGKDTMERLWKATIGELQVGPRVLEQGHTIYTTKVYTIQQGALQMLQGSSRDGEFNYETSGDYEARIELSVQRLSLPRINLS